MEELVAELGAAFLCADLELTPEPRGDHASYLDHWLKVLKSDSRAIFAAASHAQRAGDSCTACSRLGRSRGPREPPRGFAVAAELRQDLSPANCPHEPSQASVRHAAMTKPDNQLPAPVRTAAATARRMESRAAVTTGLVRAERRFPPGGRAHCSWAVLRADCSLSILMRQRRNRPRSKILQHNRPCVCTPAWPCYSIRCTTFSMGENCGNKPARPTLPTPGDHFEVRSCTRPIPSPCRRS